MKWQPPGFGCAAYSATRRSRGKKRRAGKRRIGSAAPPGVPKSLQVFPFFRPQDGWPQVSQTGISMPGNETRTPGASLEAQGIYRMQGGGFAGRIDAEEDADARRDDDGGEYGRGIDDGRPIEDGREQRRALDAQPDPNESADHGDNGGLDQELQEDVARGGADGLADADLAGALRDRDQHDIHDPDAPHDQRDDRDGCKKRG